MTYFLCMARSLVGCLRRFVVWGGSVGLAYAVHLGAFAALYLLGSAAGPLLYQFVGGRAAYNVAIAATYSAAFLASLAVSARLLGVGVGAEWVMRFVAAPTLPYLALIAYLLLWRDLPINQAILVVRAGVAYERVLTYLLAPAALAVKGLGHRHGLIGSALIGVLAGGVAYAVTAYALPAPLAALQAAASRTLPPDAAHAIAANIAPATAVGIEAAPILVRR